MDDETPKKRDILKRLNNTYRLVFIDDESLEEVVSYTLSMRRLYVVICSIFVLVAFITLSLVILTPLKYYIPGYAGGQTRKEIIHLKQNVDSLSDLVAAQEAYQENIRLVITGKDPTKLDTTILDQKKTRQEQINSLLPESKILMNQAAKSIKKENDINNKKKEK